MWTPAFACPSCRAALAIETVESVCHACGLTFESSGIPRLITAESVARTSAFLTQYRAIRRRDGHGAMTVDDYRRLPDVHAAHPAATEWRIRRESWLVLRHLLRSGGSGFRPAYRGSLRVLDVGAGNGWLSNRLCREGHAPVAVDLNVDAVDGLGACRAYESAFPVVQADFDALPLAPGQFDVVVMNASLHYAPDPAHTLAEASRTAAAGSPLVVMDSPVVVNDEEGEAMVTRQLADMQQRFGIAPVRSGLGYLTLTRLQDAAGRVGRRARFMASRGPVRWRIGRWWDRWRLGRHPAVFGVWVAR